MRLRHSWYFGAVIDIACPNLIQDNQGVSGSQFPAFLQVIHNRDQRSCC